MSYCCVLGLWQGYFEDLDTRRLSFAIFFLSVLSALVVVGLSLWQVSDRHFIHAHNNDKEGEGNASNSDPKGFRDYLNVFLDFYLLLVVAVIVALILPCCALRGLKRKDHALLQFFSGCTCCCAFLSFILAYRFLIPWDNCQDEMEYCIPVGVLNLVSFLGFIITVHLMLRLMKIINDEQENYQGARFYTYRRNNQNRNGNNNAGAQNYSNPYSFYIHNPQPRNAQTISAGQAVSGSGNPSNSAQQQTFSRVYNSVLNDVPLQRNISVQRSVQATPRRTQGQQTFSSVYENLYADNEGPSTSGSGARQNVEMKDLSNLTGQNGTNINSNSSGVNGAVTSSSSKSSNYNAHDRSPLTLT